MKSGLHMTTADRILIGLLLVLSAVLFFVLPGTVLSGGTTVEITRGRAKDLGSAAVFVSLALTGFVWILIAWARFA